MISYRAAKALLDYDPDTGKMFWRESRGRVREGQRAGTVHIQPDRTKTRRVQIDHAIYIESHVAHLLMTRHWPEELIGHRNGRPLDLRWRNLAPLSRIEKQLCGLGVRRTKQGWAARIKLHKRERFLGYHCSRAAAIRSRHRAVRYVLKHGELPP